MSHRAVRACHWKEWKLACCPVSIVPSDVPPRAFFTGRLRRDYKISPRFPRETRDIAQGEKPYSVLSSTKWEKAMNGASSRQSSTRGRYLDAEVDEGNGHLSIVRISCDINRTRESGTRFSINSNCLTPNFSSKYIEIPHATQKLATLLENNIVIFIIILIFC